GLLVGSVSQYCLHHARCPVALVKSGEVPQRTQRIVVGVDRSDAARSALAWALDAAREHRARVEVVHAWQPSVVLPLDPYLITGVETIQEAAQAELDAVVEVADDRDLVSPLEATLVMATPGRAVLDAAEDADLVVVGSRQHSAVGCL